MDKRNNYNEMNDISVSIYYSYDPNKIKRHRSPLPACQEVIDRRHFMGV